MSNAKAEDLARVRENQRRSRARKREHVERLEERIQQLENANTNATSPAQASDTRRLQRENEILRKLLTMVGFNEKFQSMYIESEITGNDEVPDPGTSLRREAARARARSRSMSHEGLITSHSTPITQAIVSSSSMNHTSLPRTTAESSQVDFAPLPDLGQNLLPMDTLPMDFNFGLSFQPPLSAYDTPSSLYPGSTLNGTLSFQTSTDGLTEQMLDDNTATTLCRTALDMIAQHNRKGYSFKDLEVRLCRGYQPEASEGADCRVQNSVLFSVLAEIQ